MTLARKTYVDQIEITRTGHVQVRMHLSVIDDNKVINQQNHRTSVAPGEDPDEQLRAVNGHLAIMDPPWPSISDAEWQRVRDHCAVAKAG
jgi:hypothetical protein